MGVSVPVTVTTGAGAQLVSAGAGRIVFASVTETSGIAGAAFTLFDGTPQTLQGVCGWTVSANGSARDDWPDHGLAFEGDLWMGATSGLATAIIHVVPEDLWHLWRKEILAGIRAELVADWRQ